MKIIIKLTKKEKELYKNSRTVVGLFSSADVRLSVYGNFWNDGNYGDGLGYAFGVEFREELYRVLKELEK